MELREWSEWIQSVGAIQIDVARAGFDAQKVDFTKSSKWEETHLPDWVDSDPDADPDDAPHSAPDPGPVSDPNSDPDSDSEVDITPSYLTLWKGNQTFSF